MISHLCYCYFRLGHAGRKISAQERLLTGVFLCDRQSNELLQELKPEWDLKIELPMHEKISLLGFAVEEIFPWKFELSEGIDNLQLCLSFLIQPDLFLRIRPGYDNAVKNKLKQAGADFYEIDDHCIELPNASGTDKILDLDKEAVVQDLNSQHTAGLLDFVRNHFKDQTSHLKVWDCCAGSGGKSILVFDLLKNIDLTVTDIRESILVNLKKRFEHAGINRYNLSEMDLNKNSFRNNSIKLHNVSFDLIICDAPCTGSGTWSRTPEQLYYFDANKIEHYSKLQKTIVQNVIPFLKPRGFLLYITCSVFKKENEEVVEFMQQNFKLELLKKQHLTGYDKKADSLFFALFRN